MPRAFIDDEPDPAAKNHQRKRGRIREKGRKASQTELNWAAKFDAADAAWRATPNPPAPPPQAPAGSPPTEAKPDEVGAPAGGGPSPAVVSSVRVPEARMAASSAAKPVAPPPLPTAASAFGAKVTPPPAPPRVSAAPNPTATTAAPGAPPPEEPWLKVASAQVQAARFAAINMIMSEVADGFEELQVKVETTMQGRKWVFPRAFWKEAWLPMATGLLNNYLPEWMSGPIVEGVTVVMPPVGLIRAASALEKAGYTLGVPGEPGRGAIGAPTKAAKPAQAQEPAKPPQDASKAPQEPAQEQPNGKRLSSVANVPAKPESGKVDPREMFGRGTN